MVCRGQMSGRLVENLEQYERLSAADRAALEALIGPPRPLAAGAEIVVEGDSTAECHLLIEGQAFRHRTLPDGRRQIMSFHAPGDLLDLQGVFLSLDYGVCALTPCQVSPISRARLEAVLQSHPTITRALWRFSLVEGAMFREWMVGMGRRTAYARTAHLLCEVFVRLRAAGLARGDRCNFPATQIHLADALGLSGVHTNRVLQSLRANGLIAYRGRELVVRDWAGLCAAGEFDPGYLHLPRERQTA